MTEPEVPDRRPLVYAAMGILIVGIAAILFWPRPAEQGPDSLVLTPQDATDPATQPIETALLASEENVDAVAPPDDAFPVENAELNEKTVVDAAPTSSTPPPPEKVVEKKPAARTTPKSAPARPAAGNVDPASVGTYLLNVGSFGERSNAAAMADKLEKQGIPARVVAAYSEGATRYRVQVGYFEGFSLADAYGKQIKQRAGVDYWVGQR